MLILDDAIFDNIWEHIYSALCHFFLLIASLIYKLANLVYQVFMAVASAKIFDSNDYQNFANKIYLVIGIVALFSLAYALLRGIVDPDSTSKDDMTVKKIVPNTLKAILLIAFVPTIFNFAYKMQDVILSQNVISNLFFDTDNLTTVQDTSFATAGSTMTNEIFLSFFMPNSKDEGDVCSNDNFDMDSCLSTVSVSFDSIDDFSKNYTQNGILNYTVPGFALGVAIIKTVTDKFENNDSITLKDAKDLVDQTGNFDIYTDFALNAAKGEINYNWLIQGIIDRKSVV